MLSSTLLSVLEILFSNSLLFFLPPWMIKGTIMVSTPTWMLIKLFSRAQTSLPNSRFYLTISDSSTSTIRKQLGFFCQNWTLYHSSSHASTHLRTPPHPSYLFLPTPNNPRNWGKSFNFTLCLSALLESLHNLKSINHNQWLVGL